MNRSKLKELLETPDQVFVFVIDRKDHIEKFDVQSVLDFLNDFKSFGKLAMNRLSIVVHGYDNDSRELIEIPEVINFIKFLDRSFPYWFFFMEKESPAKFNMLKIIFFCCCGVEIVSKNSKITEVSLKNLETAREFMINHFEYLNEIMDELKLPDKLNKQLSEQIIKILSFR